MRDLARPLPDGAHIAILTDKSGPKALELIRHDAAHVLAAAVMELYPGVKISIGPPIEDGFYYDFEFPEGVAVSEADFPQIEERMRAHVKAAEPFEREDVPVGAGARALRRRAPGLQGRADRRPRDGRRRACTASRCETVSLYTNGPFTDLCRGPHAPSTKTVGAFKLQLGRRRLLARGLDADDAHAHLRHRVLLQGRARGAPRAPRAGQGARPPQARARARPVHLLRGLARRRLLDARRHERLQLAGRALAARWARERGYSEVKTPQIYDAELWKTSGHWDKYRENMFTLEVEGREMARQADELPRPRHLFAHDAATPTATCRCATSSRACCTATSPPACCTGCCACATSPRTTRTSSAPRSRSRRRSTAASSMAFATYALFDFDVRLELSTRPEQRDRRPTRCGTAPRRSSTRALDELGPRVRAEPRRRRLLRARRSTCT